MHNTINPNDYGVLQPNGLIYPYKCPHCGEENPKAYDIGCYLKIGKNNRLFSSCVKPNHAMHPDWEKALFPDSAGNPMYQKIILYRSNGKSSTSYTSSTNYGKPEGEWYYHDKQGNPLIKIARYRNAKGEKYYVQYHYTSEGKWKKGVKGYVNREDIPIYRYREIRDAIESGETIFIIEGEKCADCPWKMGIAATTNIGGAGKGGNKWKPSDTACLDGAKELVLVPDQNKPGIEHMDNVYKQLLEYGFPDSTIKWLYPYPDSDTWNNLPEKKGLDIYDWIEDGATYKQILASIQDTKRDIIIPSNRAYTSNNNIQDIDILSNSVDQTEWEKISNKLYPIFWTEGDENSEPKRKKLDNGDYLKAIHIIYGDKLRYNLQTLEPWLDNKPFKEVDGDLEHLYVRISYLYGVEMPKERIIDALFLLAKQNEFHPVEDEFKRLAIKVEPINIDNLATRYFGIDDELANTYLKLWLIAAAARPIYPGCYVRNVLILQGNQDIGKSTFFRILGGEHFCDSLGDCKDKDQKMIAHRKHIHEWAEFEKLWRKSLRSEVKGFITATDDTFRVPYGRTTNTFKRRFVLCGTSNEEQFLKDPTGNNRFWIIAVPQKIDLEQLAKDRDAIWSAAARIVLNANPDDVMTGKLWKLPEHLLEANRENTAKYEETHEWENTIQNLIEDWGSCGFLIPNKIWEALDISKENSRRYGTEINDIMTKLGWRRSKKRRSTPNKDRYYLWVANSLSEEDVDAIWSACFK